MLHVYAGVSLGAGRLGRVAIPQETIAVAVVIVVAVLLVVLRLLGGSQGEAARED